jgi:hypothetical protein
MGVRRQFLREKRGEDDRSDGPVPLNRMRDRRERRESNVERDDAEFWERSRDNVLRARVAAGLVLTGAVGGIAGLAWLVISL